MILLWQCVVILNRSDVVVRRTRLASLETRVVRLLVVIECGVWAIRALCSSILALRLLWVSRLATLVTPPCSGAGLTLRLLPHLTRPVCCSPALLTVWVTDGATALVHTRILFDMP